MKLSTDKIPLKPINAVTVFAIMEMTSAFLYLTCSKSVIKTLSAKITNISTIKMLLKRFIYINVAMGRVKQFIRIE